MPPSRIGFFLEADSAGAEEAVLPVSGVRISRAAQPLLTAADIAFVDRARLELGEGVLFQLNARGIRKLAELGENAKGRRLVLLLDGVALGVYRIEDKVADGRMYLFVEVPDAELPRLVATLESSASSLQREWRVAK